MDHALSQNGTNSTIENLIRSEQTGLLYKAMPLVIMATCLNAMLLVFVLWPVIDHDILRSWLAVLALILVFRAVLAIRYNRLIDTQSGRLNYDRWHTLGAVLTGAMWGACSIWLFPENEVTYQVFLAFVLAGMTAGASTTLSFQRLPVFAFVLLALVPLCIRFFMTGTTISMAMAIMTVLFLIIILSSSLTMYENTRQNVAMRIQSDFQKRALRESEERYRLVFNTAPLGVMHYDSAGIVQEFNDTFVHLTGVSRESLQGLSLVHDMHDPQLISGIHQSLLGNSGQFNSKASAFGGDADTDIRVFCYGIPGENGMITSGVVIVEDISEEKRNERLKSEFVSTVSHELRTPLTSIRGAVGLLKGEFAKNSSSRCQKLVDIAQSNAERLLLLINDLLDIDKIESGLLSFDFKIIDVMSMIEEALRGAETYAGQYNILFRIGSRADGTKVQGDRDRLIQVMYNLLSNASKFSPPGSTVDINVTQRNETVMIEVADKGAGIPVEFQPMVFDRFTQSDSSDARHAGGTGLGLSITRSLVEKHGGEIGFRTDPNGTTFYVVLPAIA